MEKSHEKIIEKMLEDIRQIPGYVNGFGTKSSTLSSYVQIARDYQEAHNHEIIILDSIFALERLMKVHKNSDCDESEIDGGIEYYTELLEEHSKELHEFILERKAKHWQ